MNFDQNRHRIFLQAAFSLTWLLCADATTFAQDSAKSATEKWRPKEGTYAAPGADYSLRCGEFGDVIVELAKKTISGNEWSCKVNKLTDTAPGAIRLEMICDDYNLAEDLHFPEGKKFMETMLLKKQDEKTISVRKTKNGKFKFPSWQASYCPADEQRMYTEAEARSKAEAKQKATTEKLKLNPWRPQDGVYTTPGANFEDRCLKAGDAVIEISERSISSGADKCSVTFIRDEPNALQLFATCGQEANARGSIPSLPSPETIILKKIDDKTVFLQKSKGGNFTDPATRLSFCGPDAQKMYAQQKAKK